MGWDSVVGEWSRVEGHSADPDPNDPYGMCSVCTCVCGVYMCVRCVHVCAVCTCVCGVCGVYMCVWCVQVCVVCTCVCVP